MHRQYDDVFARHPEVQRIRKTGKDRAPGLAAHPRKRKRTLDDARHSRVDFGAKLLAEPGAPCFVPAADVECLILGLRPKTKARVTRVSTACAVQQTKAPRNQDWLGARPSVDRAPPSVRR